MEIAPVSIGDVFAGLAVLVAGASCYFAWLSKSAAETSAKSSVKSADAASQSAAVARANVEIGFEIEPIMTKLVVEGSEVAGVRLKNVGANVFIHDARLDVVEVKWRRPGDTQPGPDDVGIGLGKTMTLSERSPDTLNISPKKFPTYLHRDERVDLYVESTDPELVGKPVIRCDVSVYYTFDGMSEPIEYLVVWHTPTHPPTAS